MESHGKEARRLVNPLRVGANFLCLGALALGMFAYPRMAHKRPVKIDYNRDVRPILDKCLSCHGHDPKAIQAGLRLDSRDGATKLLADGNRAVVPGHPEKSELIVRINEQDPAMLMPPPSSNRVLSTDDKEILKAWIAQGAEYKQHWAFVKPVRSKVPVVSLTTWPKNPIDNFILARLESEGLKPSKEADKETLLRRVSLDLTGLPASRANKKSSSPIYPPTPTRRS